MKSLFFSLVLLSIILMAKPAEAQTGWVQTQLNSGIGYSLFANDSVALAATYDGVFSTTSDGIPWFSKGPANRSVYDVIMTEHSILAATGDGIFRSTDKGNTWELVSQTLICSGVGGTQGHQVFTRNGSIIFAHTWGQGVFRSADDGKNWQLLTVGTQPGLSGDIGGWATCIYVFAGKIFIGAPEGDIGIYFSADNGNTWAMAKSSNPIRWNHILFFCAVHDTIYAGGFNGLFRSVDSGNNWAPQYINTINTEGQMIGLGTFRDLVSHQNELIAAVDAKSIQISNDAGKNWTSFNEGLVSDWTFADLAIKPPYIWALTTGFGNAYKRPLSEILTGISSEMKDGSNDNSIGQNYPNPFSTITKIRYTIKNTEKVVLSVYDIFGKQVAILVNDTQTPGIYELMFNAKNLENGTYYYRLTAGNFQQSRKLLIVK